MDIQKKWGNQSENRFQFINSWSQFELAMNFALFCTFMKPARCFIKYEDNLGEGLSFHARLQKV